MLKAFGNFKLFHLWGWVRGWEIGRDAVGVKRWEALTDGRKMVIDCLSCLEATKVIHTGERGGCLFAKASEGLDLFIPVTDI